MWTCPKCGSKVDPSFEVCWNCGTTADGIEDPTFVKADDAGPIESPPVVPELNTGPDVAPTGEWPAGSAPAEEAGELVPCYQALSLMEAQFLVARLSEEGIPAVCDQADMQDALGTWEGNPRVYCREADLPRAREWLAKYDAERKSHISAHLEQ